MAMRRAQGAGLLSAAAVACLVSAPGLAQDCHVATTRVVGGKQARISQWPGQATLRSTTKGGKSALYFCGAAAISDTWVVTAAHCVDDIAAGMQKRFSNRAGQPLVGTIQVVIGVDDLDKVRDENVYEVEKIVVRDGYTEASASGRDIAVIQLKRPYQGPVARLSVQPGTDPKTPPGAQVRVADSDR